MVWKERVSLKGNGCGIQASCQVLHPFPISLILEEELFAVPDFVVRRWALDDMPPAAGKLKGWKLGNVVLVFQITILLLVGRLGVTECHPSQFIMFFATLVQCCFHFLTLPDIISNIIVVIISIIITIIILNRHWPCLPFSYIFKAGTPFGNKYLGLPPWAQAAGLGMECPFPKSQLDYVWHESRLLHTQL